MGEKRRGMAVVVFGADRVDEGADAAGCAPGRWRQRLRHSNAHQCARARDRGLVLKVDREAEVGEFEHALLVEEDVL